MSRGSSRPQPTALPPASTTHLANNGEQPRQRYTSPRNRPASRPWPRSSAIEEGGRTRRPNRRGPRRSRLCPVMRRRQQGNLRTASPGHSRSSECLIGREGRARTRDSPGSREPLAGKPLARSLTSGVPHQASPMSGSTEVRRQTLLVRVEFTGCTPTPSAALITPCSQIEIAG